MHSCGKKADTFHQALYIGVRDFDSIHTQSARDLGKLLCEFSPHLAQMLKFEVVIVQKAGIHGAGSLRVLQELLDFKLNMPLTKFANVDFTGFQVNISLHEKLQRHRLRPDIGMNANADDVVAIHLAFQHQRLNMQAG